PQSRRACADERRGWRPPLRLLRVARAGAGVDLTLASSAPPAAMSSDLDRQIEQLKRCEYIKEPEVKALCAKAREILVEESNVQRVDAPVTVRRWGGTERRSCLVGEGGREGGGGRGDEREGGQPSEGVEEDVARSVHRPERRRIDRSTECVEANWEEE
ncbi:MAG: hypothetical protein SGPRY_014717, partial [Prymnesium sp.]